MTSEDTVFTFESYDLRLTITRNDSNGGYFEVTRSDGSKIDGIDGLITFLDTLTKQRLNLKQQISMLRFGCDEFTARGRNAVKYCHPKESK